MNAITLLKEDHERAMELIDQIETLGENGLQAADLFGQLKEALSLHTEMEENVFYPALSQFEETKDLVEEAYRTHQEVDDFVADISNLPPRDEEFLDQIAELRERIENHVGEEEDVLFPKLKSFLGRAGLKNSDERWNSLPITRRRLHTNASSGSSTGNIIGGSRLASRNEAVS